eukprot:994301-Rhodomonas_salina.1
MCAGLDDLEISTIASSAQVAPELCALLCTTARPLLYPVPRYVLPAPLCTVPHHDLEISTIASAAQFPHRVVRPVLYHVPQNVPCAPL